MNKEVIRQLNALIAAAGSIRGDEDRVELCYKVAPLLAVIDSNVEREHFTTRAAEAIGMTRDSLAVEVAREIRHRTARQYQPPRTIVDALDDLTAVMESIFNCVSEIADTLKELADKRTAQGAPNTLDGKAEQAQPDSAPIVPESEGGCQA